jgi:hypothetical protein
MISYSFDVLPLHPQPQPLETLTSYLARLAQANGFFTISSVAKICLPSIHIKVVRHFNDYLPLSLDILPIVANCPSEKLYATSFAPIVEIFGRSIHPHAASRFLGGTVAKYLRYCPYCLKEKPWYILPWRFLLVKICPVHQCYLLEACLKCGNVIRVWSPNTKIGICPTCQGELSQAAANPVQEAEQEILREQWDDTVFLCNTGLTLLNQATRSAAIGAVFKQLRVSQRLSIHDFAGRLQISRDTFFALEGGSEQRGVIFEHYVSYANALNLSLRNVILHAFSSFVDINISHPNTLENVHQKSTDNLPLLQYHGLCFSIENEFITKLHKFVSDMQESGKPIARWAIMAVIGIKQEELHMYPRLRVEIERSVEPQKIQLRRQFKDREQYVNHLAHRIQNTIEQLRTNDILLTKKIIHGHSGVHAMIGHKHPEIDEIVSMAISNDQAARVQRYIDEALLEFNRMVIDDKVMMSVKEVLSPHLTSGEILEKWRKCQWLEEAHYWHVLWLLNMGVPVSEVSLIVGIGRVGIRNIRIRYNEEGPEKVFVQTRPKPRQQLKILTADVESDLRAVLEQPTSDGKPWSGPKVAAWLCTRTGRQVGRSTGVQCLRKLGYYSTEDHN